MIGFSCAIMVTWEGFLTYAFLFLDIDRWLSRVCSVFTAGLSKSVPCSSWEQDDSLT